MRWGALSDFSPAFDPLLIAKLIQSGRDLLETTQLAIQPGPVENMGVLGNFQNFSRCINYLIFHLVEGGGHCVL